MIIEKTAEKTVHRMLGEYEDPGNHTREWERLYCSTGKGFG